MEELRMNSKKAKSKKPIKGYDKVYYADKDGSIYRNETKLNPANNGIGYYQIKLRCNKKRFNRYVHRIIWETFKGPIPEGYEVNHIDHDKSNNSLINLELVSHSENLHKAFLKYGYFGSMGKGNIDKLTLSQAKSTLLEGAETTGEVKAS